MKTGKAKAQQVLVRAKWSRPAWCRDDWCRIRLPNRYSYYCPVAVVQFEKGDRCLVRATTTQDHPSISGVQCRYTDFDGEGSLDYVYLTDLVGWEEAASP